MYKGARDPQQAWDLIQADFETGLSHEPDNEEDWLEWAIDVYEAKYKAPLDALKTSNPRLAARVAERLTW